MNCKAVIPAIALDLSKSFPDHGYKTSSLATFEDLALDCDHFKKYCNRAERYAEPCRRGNQDLVCQID